jgi:hypothetical protein
MTIKTILNEYSSEKRATEHLLLFHSFRSISIAEKRTDKHSSGCNSTRACIFYTPTKKPHYQPFFCINFAALIITNYMTTGQRCISVP